MSHDRHLSLTLAVQYSTVQDTEGAGVMIESILFVFLRRVSLVLFGLQ